MAKKRRGRRGMGLLPKGLRSAAREQGADPFPPGETKPPRPRTGKRAGTETPAGVGTEPAPEDMDSIRDKREWQDPCHFSCVPWLFRPVDVYNPDGTEFSLVELE